MLKIKQVILEFDTKILKQEISQIEDDIKKKKSLKQINRKFPSNDKSVAKKQSKQLDTQIENLEIRLSKKQDELKQIK